MRRAVELPGNLVGFRIGIAVFLLLLAGCTVVGPRSISSGRLDYNAAIADTNSQQLLMAIVRNRFQEEVSLLSVSTVTANVKMRSSGAVEVGVGDVEGYQGNLVPFSAGVYYEENPTISYVPVSSQKYIHHLASPISVGSLARLSAALSGSASLFELLVKSVNGIYNPDFMHEGVEVDADFSRLTRSLSRLSHGHRLHWVEVDAQPESFAIVVTDYADDYLDDVQTVTELLGVAAPTDTSEDLVLSISLAVHGRELGAVGITTRSVMRLVEIFSAAVEVPERYADQAQRYPALGPMAEGLRIRASSGEPEDAAVAVRYRGNWYYIDSRDRRSKSAFRLLSALWSVVISEGASGTSAAPVLTVPVSG
jgi:hypothetical protein